MEFSRQEYCSGWPFCFSEGLPDPGAKTGSPALQADSLPCEPPEKLLVWNALHNSVKSEITYIFMQLFAVYWKWKRECLISWHCVKKDCKLLKELLIFKSCFPEFTYLRAMESNRVIHLVKTNVLEIWGKIVFHSGWKLVIIIVNYFNTVTWYTSVRK